MATLVQSYKTADGKVFNTEIEANGHEKYLEVKQDVEAFIEAQGLVKAGAGIVRKQIPAFLAYMENKQ